MPYDDFWTVLNDDRQYGRTWQQFRDKQWTFYFTYDIRIGLKHEDVVLQ